MVGNPALVKVEVKGKENGFKWKYGDQSTRNHEIELHVMVSACESLGKEAGVNRVDAMMGSEWRFPTHLDKIINVCG